jgi:hypothetical protein
VQFAWTTSRTSDSRLRTMHTNYDGVRLKDAIIYLPHDGVATITSPGSASAKSLI